MNWQSSTARIYATSDTTSDTVSDAALLDTHALIWYSVTPQKLSSPALEFIRKREHRIYVSAMTAWEIAIKVRLGKLEQARLLYRDYPRSLAHYGFLELPFTSVHALAAAELASEHKDPFDRALGAQALSEQLPLITQDALVAELPGVNVLW